MKKILCAIVLFSFFWNSLIAQTNLSAYTDIGKNNVSDGYFLKLSPSASYEWKRYKIESGFQMNIVSVNENIFSGIRLNALREFSIGKNKFDARVLFLYNPFSGIFTETNLAFILNHDWNHFSLMLGTDFRTFAYTKDAIETYELIGNTKLHENWNTIYSVGFYLKSIDYHWNIGINMTNLDYFQINQETNPEFNIKGFYNINSGLKVFAETWYKSSGAFNLSVNPFGFFFRTGVVWKIGS